MVASWHVSTASPTVKLLSLYKRLEIHLSLNRLWISFSVVIGKAGEIHTRSGRIMRILIHLLGIIADILSSMNKDVVLFFNILCRSLAM